MARLLTDSHAQLAHALALQVQLDAQRLADLFQRQNDICSARGDGWSQQTCLREQGGHRPGMIQAAGKLSLAWDRRPK